MIIKVFVHTLEKRAELNTLLDCGATENFLDFKAVKKLNLLIKCLPYAQPVFNVDGSKNKSGDIKYYTDMTLQTGEQTHLLVLPHLPRGTNGNSGLPMVCSGKPDRKSTRLNSSHRSLSRMPSSA